MIPQGSTNFDAAYFNNLAAEINSIDSCALLQDLVNEAFASIQAQATALEAQLGLLEPLQILLELPTDITSVIKWITALANNLIAPILKPIVTYIAQITAMLAAIANLTTAIENAASRIGSCSISVPPVIGLVLPT